MLHKSSLRVLPETYTVPMPRPSHHRINQDLGGVCVLFGLCLTCWSFDTVSNGAPTQSPPPPNSTQNHFQPYLGKESSLGRASRPSASPVWEPTETRHFHSFGTVHKNRTRTLPARVKNLTQRRNQQIWGDPSVKDLSGEIQRDSPNSLGQVACSNCIRLQTLIWPKPFPRQTSKITQVSPSVAPSVAPAS